jgi:hypothetical protein
MNLPKNILLPFFAYGLFKPGQIGYFRIKNDVETYKKAKIDGYLRQRDGIPLLVKETGRRYVNGFVLYFKEDLNVNAYNNIVEIEPDFVYEWDECCINIDDQTVKTNVLVGRRVVRGSSKFLDDFPYEWDGKEDPMFKYGLQMIDDIVKKNTNCSFPDKKGFIELFELEMAYGFLWSIIERYAGLKYNLKKEPSKKIEFIEKEPTFIIGLEKYIKEKRKVYRIDNLECIELDPNNPKKCLQYYYQIRSNTVHRGKAVFDDFKTIRLSLEELLKIFNDMLKESFDK